MIWALIGFDIEFQNNEITIDYNVVSSPPFDSLILCEFVGYIGKQLFGRFRNVFLKFSFSPQLSQF